MYIDNKVIQVEGDIFWETKSTLYRFGSNEPSSGLGGACGVVVIAVENEHGGTSSNPGRYWLHFT